MGIGMLWFDDSPSETLAEAVQRAALHYKGKYGCMPDLCYVHPRAIVGGREKVERVGSVEVRTLSTVLPHHFWLGMEDEDDE